MQNLGKRVNCVVCSVAQSLATGIPGAKLELVTEVVFFVKIIIVPIFTPK